MKFYEEADSRLPTEVPVCDITRAMIRLRSVALAYALHFQDNLRALSDRR